MTDAVKPVYKVADIRDFAQKNPKLVKSKKTVTLEVTLDEKKIARAIKLGVSPESLGVDIVA